MTIDRVALAPCAARSHTRRVVLSGALVLLIRLYQLTLSPLLGPCCRFYPSCSHYAIGAIRVHGPLRGCALAAWRILRCNPLVPGGFDPVPPLRGRTTAVLAAPVEPTQPVERLGDTTV